MWSYFKPLRRKLGVLTLVLACVCMSACVRSRSSTDSIAIPVGQAANIQIESFRCTIIFLLYQHTSQVRWNSHPSSEEVIFGWNSQTRTALNFSGFGGGAIDEKPDDPTQEREMWSSLFNIFGCEVHLRSGCKCGQAKFGVVLPYWSIVIPFTLASVWLLLSRSQSARPVPPVPGDV